MIMEIVAFMKFHYRMIIDCRMSNSNHNNTANGNGDGKSGG